MAAGTPFSNITSLFGNQPSSQPLSSPLFLSGSNFLGSRSMMSFEGEGGKGCNGSFFGAFDMVEENGEECMEEYFHQPEKKRRLSTNQVQFLEKSFEEENKLEPERKIKLAKDLGLQPRQVAIWFQNRRSRWKTKQLEKDYDTLHAAYETLKSNYDNLLKEKDKLKAEVASLSEKVLARDKQQGETEETKGVLNLQEEETPQRALVDSISEGEGSKVSSVVGGCKQEDISSARSDILDSSYVFEPDQSDMSQDEEDNLTNTLFTKLEEHVDYSDPHETCCNFGFPEEDHALWTWAY